MSFFNKLLPGIVSIAQIKPQMLSTYFQLKQYSNTPSPKVFSNELASNLIHMCTNYPAFFKQKQF